VGVETRRPQEFEGRGGEMWGWKTRRGRRKGRSKRIIGEKKITIKMIGSDMGAED
jgi:allantoicase